MISLLYFLTLTIFDIGLYYICVFVVRVNLGMEEVLSTTTTDRFNFTVICSHCRYAEHW